MLRTMIAMILLGIGFRLVRGATEWAVVLIAGVLFAARWLAGGLWRMGRRILRGLQGEPPRRATVQARRPAL